MKNTKNIEMLKNNGQTVSINNKLTEWAAKPGIRWWWFAQLLKEVEIREQISWAVSMGFGLIEIAWIYPLEKKQRITRSWELAHENTYGYVLNHS